MPMREPVSSSRIFEIICWRNSSWPSEMRGRPAPKRPSVPKRLCLFAYRVLVLLPVHAIGRIGQHVVKRCPLVGIVRQRIAEGDLLGVVAGHQHVRFADAEGLAVQLLAEQFDTDRGVELLQRLFCQRQHAAGPAGRVIDLPDDALARQFGVVVGDEQLDDEADDFARREVLARRFVRDFRKPPDQILEQITHFDVVDALGVQVDLREAVEHLPENTALVEAFQLFGKEKLVEEDVADIAGELGDVVDQVVVQLTRVLSLQAFEGEGTEVVDIDVLAGSGEQDHVPGRVIHGVGQPPGRFEDILLGRIKEAIETAQHDERQNDLAIFGPLEIAAQNLRDRPDESRRDPGYRHSSLALLSLLVSHRPADCRSIHLSISPRRNRQAPPTLKPGILPSAAWRYAVFSVSFRYSATSRIVIMSLSMQLPIGPVRCWENTGKEWNRKERRIDLKSAAQPSSRAICSPRCECVERRTFDRVEMAEGVELGTNVL